MNSISVVRNRSCFAVACADMTANVFVYCGALLAFYSAAAAAASASPSLPAPHHLFLTSPTDHLARANYSNEFLAEANDYNITNRVLDIFLFTQYCGPSNRVFAPFMRRQSSQITYADLDVCCHQHDNCENYILGPDDYGRYPGLTQKNQFFARFVIWIYCRLNSNLHFFFR